MSQIRKGMRVHVEFDADVVSADADSSLQQWARVLVGGSHVTVMQAHCTVIGPPIAVGDIVTADNIGQLPYLSIVARRGYFPRTRETDGTWSVPGGLPCSDENMTLDKVEPIVLRIGGGGDQ